MPHACACSCVCTREYTRVRTLVRCKSNTCALPKLMRITLTRSAWLFFLRFSSKSLIVSSCECDRNSRVHCVCECAYSRVTRERRASAVKLLVSGTVALVDSCCSLCRLSSVDVYFASASYDRTARLWSTDIVHPLRILAGHTASVDVRESSPAA